MYMRYDRLRNLREDIDKSQKDVAEYLNCSQVAYSYYEIGKRDIPTATLICLAQYFNCSVDYLLGLTDVKEPYPAPYEKGINRVGKK